MSYLKALKSFRRKVSPKADIVSASGETSLSCVNNNNGHKGSLQFVIPTEHGLGLEESKTFHASCQGRLRVGTYIVE